MYSIGFLIGFPMLVALILFFLKNDALRRVVVCVASVLIIGVTLLFAMQDFFDLESRYYLTDTHWIDWAMFLVEMGIGVYIIYLGVKFRRYYVSLLSVLQLILVGWLEFSGEGEQGLSHHIFSDKLSIIMAVIIGVVGCMVCIYALGYMKDYHQHHTEYRDRRPFFFAVLFVFLGAMFGLVFSNHLVWMFFFWEVTTLCSFLLIGYTQTEEAIRNSFRTLWMNLLGGCGFAVALVYCSHRFHTLELNRLLEIGSQAPSLMLIPVLFLVLAALTKSAQLPFSTWLLGAMVAPTPSSALLHSATMVKAGVYMMIRLSPLLAGNIAGLLVTNIGGFTFLMASLLAVSQSDAKKLLAYSTVANLGLITACAGIGLPESVWAATLLVIFHAVSKSLMFLAVGAVENNIGSRNIEDMHGLIVKLPEMALVLIIGIAGMFLAPFGMLISKWAALKSFIDSDSILLILFLVYGSAATLLYWTKWLSKLVAVLHNSERLPNTVKGTEWLSLITQASIMIVLCLTFPLISRYLIEPFLVDIFGQDVPVVISEGNLNIMTFMLCTIVILPIAIRFLAFSRHNKIVTSYMAGVNAGNDRMFIDSLGEKKSMYLSNWYFQNWFGEKKLLRPSLVLAAGALVTLFIIGIGGAL